MIITRTSCYAGSNKMLTVFEVKLSYYTSFILIVQKHRIL